MASLQSLDEETVYIDPSGDVLFIVGGDKPITRLLVSSKVLSLASPVFAAMFSPRFREGSNLNSNSHSEVPLPEDDPETMTILCNCLHFRTDHVPRNMEYSSLKALAILCDKYDAAKAISAWNVLWFRKWETLEREDGFEGILLVIYALDCAEAFAEVSRTAILDQVGPFDTHKVVAGLDMVPHSPLGDLEAQREAVQASLQESLEDITTPILKSNCARKQQLVYAYFYNLHKSSLWPLSAKFHQSSLSTILDRVSSFPSNDFEDCCRYQCSSCDFDFNSRLLEIKTKHFSSIKSLCLDCVKRKGSNLKENKKACRFVHP